MPVATNIPRDDRPGLASVTHAGAASLERRRARAVHLPFQVAPEREAAEDTRGADRALWKKMVMRALLVLAPIAVLALAIVGASFADCSTSMAPVGSAGEMQAFMEIGAARSCFLRLSAAPETIQKLEVTEPPRGGNLTVRGRSGVLYHAANDFDGTDAFSLLVHGRGATGDAQATKINVRIGPRRHNR
jgi:hypothetical protein